MSSSEPGAGRRRFRITRDGILFVTGLAGIIYETVVHHGENPTLLILFGAMCGLPAFLNVDERFQRRPPLDTKQDLEGPAEKRAGPKESE